MVSRGLLYVFLGTGALLGDGIGTEEGEGEITEAREGEGM
jgi:hypothetical protein